MSARVLARVGKAICATMMLLLMSVFTRLWMNSHTTQKVSQTFCRTLPPWTWQVNLISQSSCSSTPRPAPVCSLSPTPLRKVILMWMVIGSVFQPMCLSVCLATSDLRPRHIPSMRLCLQIAQHAQTSRQSYMTLVPHVTCHHTVANSLTISISSQRRSQPQMLEPFRLSGEEICILRFLMGSLPHAFCFEMSCTHPRWDSHWFPSAGLLLLGLQPFFANNL